MANTVLFYLNGERVELFEHEFDPFTLLSTFVREHGLTGTKGKWVSPPQFIHVTVSSLAVSGLLGATYVCSDLFA